PTEGTIRVGEIDLAPLRGRRAPILPVPRRDGLPAIQPGAAAPGLRQRPRGAPRASGWLGGPAPLDGAAPVVHPGRAGHRPPLSRPRGAPRPGVAARRYALGRRAAAGSHRPRPGPAAP